MIFFLLFLGVIAASLCLPTWGTYQPPRLFSLVNTNSSQSIQLAIVEQSSLISFANQVKVSSYDFHDGYNYFQKRIQTHDNQSIIIKGELGDQFNITLVLNNIHKIIILFTDRKNQSQINSKQNVYYHQDLIITNLQGGNSSLKWCNLNSIGIFDTIQQTQSGNSLAFVFESPEKKTSTINFNNKNQDRQSESQTIYKQSFIAKQNEFMKHYELNDEYKNIITHAISNTIGSISFRKTKSNQYFQLKSKYQEISEKSNLGLSTFIIQILSYFNKQLQNQLFDSFVQRLEDDSIYSSEQHLFTVPEHSDIFLKFPHRKSIKVLNSIIYRNLFHKVNHVIGHQSADYHSSKELHPILKKLLQISWESDYNFLKSNSVYTESFLNDAYIHSEQQDIEISVSKTVWLIKTIRILIELNKQSETLSMQQLKTLENNLREYFKNTCYSKQQKLFKSISSVERSRYYSRVLSYESFLPFVYKIQPKYQQSYSSIFKIMKNVTTERGIMSQQASVFSNDQYNFRGRIWAYFNYKIVEMFSTPQNMLQQYIAKDIYSKGAENVEQVLGDITKLLKKIEVYQKRNIDFVHQAVKKQILGDWQKKKELYASWSLTGETFDSNPELILINALFLK